MNLLRVLLAAGFALLAWTILEPVLGGRRIAEDEGAAVDLLTRIRKLTIEERPGAHGDLAARVLARLQTEVPDLARLEGPDGSTIVSRKGYLCRILPYPGKEGVPAGIEVYAWPFERHGSGISVFALNLDEVIMRARNLIQHYDGLEHMPAPGSCAMLREAASGPVPVAGAIIGNDGERWTPVAIK